MSTERKIELDLTRLTFPSCQVMGRHGLDRRETMALREFQATHGHAHNVAWRAVEVSLIQAKLIKTSRTIAYDCLGGSATWKCLPDNHGASFRAAPPPF